jgi:hypothetical protein
MRRKGTEVTEQAKEQFLLEALRTEYLRSDGRARHARLNQGRILQKVHDDELWRQYGSFKGCAKEVFELDASTAYHRIWAWEAWQVVPAQARSSLALSVSKLAALHSLAPKQRVWFARAIADESLTLDEVEERVQRFRGHRPAAPVEALPSPMRSSVMFEEAEEPAQAAVELSHTEKEVTEPSTPVPPALEISDGPGVLVEKDAVSSSVLVLARSNVIASAGRWDDDLTNVVREALPKARENLDELERSLRAVALGPVVFDHS